MKKQNMLGLQETTLTYTMKRESDERKPYRTPEIREISTSYYSKKRHISLGCWNCGGSDTGAVHC